MYTFHLEKYDKILSTFKVQQQELQTKVQQELLVQVQKLQLELLDQLKELKVQQ